MTFTLDCMTGQLSAALRAANTVTDHGIKYPVLKASRLAVDGGTAHIIATNTDQAIHSRIAGNGSGVVHLDTVALTTKINALEQAKPVHIEADASGKSVTISQGRTKWKLPVLMNDAGFDFEASAATLDGDAIELNAGQILAALTAVRPAFSTDGSRHYLSGACIEFTGGRLRAVATDGNILACVQIPGKFTPRDSFLMPPQAVAASSRLFDASVALQLVVTENAFTLDDGDTLFRSKMIEGTFPDWERIIPKSSGSVDVDAAEFLAAIDRVAAIKEDIGKASKFVPVTMVFHESEIELTTANKDGEEGADYCACERQGDKDFHVVFSADTLLTALRSFGGIDTLRMAYSASMRRYASGVSIEPVVFSRAVSEGEDFRLVNVLIDSRGEI